LLEDLEWLGLEPDLGSPAEFRGGATVHRQSDRDGAYQEALAGLAAKFPVYACDCSRKDIAGDSETANQETRYPGRCRSRGLPLGQDRGVRVVLDPGVEHFTDCFLGDQCQEPLLQCGDLLLRDRTGNWTYQFAVTVDDFDQEINLVIRGEDLLGSTGRQLRLARMLGRTDQPAYAHHPLIRGSSGAKLSKANRDTGIRELRVAGVSAATVLGWAAHLTGLLSRPRNLHPAELPALFATRGRPG
jgi:glutamyl-tRNA synthetase/glutamyl-Q tRNA(Asp) synthetase